MANVENSKEQNVALLSAELDALIKQEREQSKAERMAHKAKIDALWAQKKSLRKDAAGIPAEGTKVRVVGIRDANGKVIAGPRNFIGEVGVVLASKSNRRRTCVNILVTDKQGHAVPLYLKAIEVEPIAEEPAGEPKAG